jgi:hypothetical protein
LIADWWPLVVQASRRTANLGGCLAEARHQLEGRWGQQTLELPLSVVCQSEEFACFTAHLLAHLPRLQEIYNLSLAEYRRVNHVRSRSHPVPDLAADDQWLEAPFWIWSREQPHRRRLFVRAWGESLELTDRAGWRYPLSASADGQAEPAIEQLCDLARQGIKLRPRALVTTMYARLVLGDLFLHGIGGAKYDQLTDLIIQRFFGLTPPHLLTLSATALLLEDRCGELRDQVRKTRELLRDMRYHPERHIVPSAAAQRWCAEKADRLAGDPPRGQRRQWHQAIESVNAALQSHLSVAPESLRRQLEAQTAALRQAVLFASREFAFCLFPENILRPLLLALSTAAL